MARIVLVEPFYGGSHRCWCDGWVLHSRHEIELLTLPDRFWRWRLRGASATMAEDYRALIEARGRPDAVVVSSLIDLAAFLGLARRSLLDTPVGLYMHENQLLYPVPVGGPRPGDELNLINWRSLLAADAVWFNSKFHSDALLEHLPQLLARHPEPTHAHMLTRVEGRSRVLWPGVNSAQFIGLERVGVEHRGAQLAPVILWNQRWDFDKNPADVFSALATLADAGTDFKVVLAGARSVSNQERFAPVLDKLADRVTYSGYAPPALYERLLVQSDVVVSAARHEFFGIAVVEAIAAGAIPVLPRRLSYPELIDPRFHGDVLYDEGDLVERLAEVLNDLNGFARRLAPLRQSMMRFDWSIAAPAHDEAVERLVARELQ